MGHQKMTEYEVDQTINRLYYRPTHREPVQEETESKGMTTEEIEEMVRLWD